MSLVHKIHGLSQMAEKKFNEEAGSDLTPRQHAILAAIDDKPGLNLIQLVSITGVDRSTMSDVIKRLKKRGLVALRRSKDDARAYVVTPTNDGERARRQGDAAMRAVEDYMRSAVPQIAVIEKAHIRHAAA